MVGSKLPHDEAQAAVFRGCARLNMAMKVKHIAGDAAQSWEDKVLKEVDDILDAAFRGPLPNLIIPPLPVALKEIQQRLEGRRPMMPSDIHSPFDQAGSSPWAIWITHEHDPKIPSCFDLGDPNTFWWTDVEEAATKVCTSNDEDSEDDHPAISDLQAAGKQRDSTTASEPDPSIGSWRSKRSRADPPSGDDGDHLYKYVPKCDSCNDRGWVCRTVGSGFACTPCKIRKHRCSARGESSVVTRSDDSMITPVKKKSRAMPEKSIIEMFRSQVAAGTSGGETTPILTEGTATGSVTSPPSKPQREVFDGVEIPSCTVGPVEQPNIGPPGGKWKWQKRAERVATARNLSSDPSASSFESSTVTAAVITAPVTRRATSAASVPGHTPTSILLPDTRMTPTGRVLVDKGVATEDSPLERHNQRQTEFLKALAVLILDVVHQDHP
ncbi:hypothetical protein JVT61DRAFT_6823 [Boletus reticuloceps]|uniref:Zn(2)-C6 fungal-type domain-containing protein n=1 Tax=Boletus reticuloceps TaxID=495285 RepID=A0A8I2YKA6_9AGAM|nr:hypothetical protein JVT61DRAFT_6823 [Boletus reticuloceps]